jgi:pyridoxamine 5'-phosphate oxidase
LVFYWPELERQVCVSGKVTKVSRRESLEYFNSRPLEARIAAWVSEQSQPVKSRELLERKFRALARQFNGKSVPMPDNWGGFRLKPLSIEFWQGRENRLNDRLRYRRKSGSGWKIERIQP